MSPPRNKKKYLNKEERLNVVVLSSFAQYLDNTAKELNDFVLLRKYIKMASTFIKKVIDELIININKEQFGIIQKDIKDRQVAVRYTDQAMREHKEMEQLSTTVLLSKEDFYDLVETVLGVNCKGCKQDKEGCKVYRVFLQNGVEILGADRDCPYQY